MPMMGNANRNATSRLDSMGYPPADGMATGAGKRPMGDVNYRAATDMAKSCGDCLHFQPPSGCELVAGNIDPAATCDLFEVGSSGPGDAAAEPVTGPGPLAAPAPLR